MGMCVGEKRKITVPPEQAYGDKGVGGLIPGNTLLWIVIEV